MIINIALGVLLGYILILLFPAILSGLFWLYGFVGLIGIFIINLIKVSLKSIKLFLVSLIKNIFTTPFGILILVVLIGLMISIIFE